MLYRSNKEKQEIIGSENVDKKYEELKSLVLLQLINSNSISKEEIKKIIQTAYLEREITPKQYNELTNYIR